MYLEVHFYLLHTILSIDVLEQDHFWIGFFRFLPKDPKYSHQILLKNKFRIAVL